MNGLTQTCMDSLIKKGFKASFFEAPEALAKFLLEEIGRSSVGIGGSMTIDALNIYDKLSAQTKVFWHWKTPQDPETRKKANCAEVYLSSANAISAAGEIVNIDGNGNRVSAMSFGAKKVFIVCGENKIADTAENAMLRARNIAAPLNAKRIQAKTPCALKADKCHNCNSPERICRVFSTITRPINNMPLHVLFIRGSWGY